MAEKQNELIAKMDSQGKDLEAARKMLLDSQLAQARMDGELKALQLMAGKIGQGNSADMKQLVGAVQQVAVGGSVNPLTKEQLCDRTMAWVRKVRAFGQYDPSTDMAAWQQENQQMAQAKTQGEKQAIWNRDRLVEFQRNESRELDFRNNYLGEGLYLRDELKKRLPSLPTEDAENDHEINRMFGGDSSLWAINPGTSYMEELTRMLCPQ